MKKDSTEFMLEHSAAKVRLLKEYISGYLGILSNTTWITEIHIYDLFCGPGVYKGGGQGSPMVFLTEIIKAQNTVAGPRNNRVKFICTFNDQSNQRIQLLQDHIQNSQLDISKFGEIEYSNCDYKEILPSIIRKMRSFRNERGFVFIDPFGYKNINLADIRDLTSSGKSEVLLFLPTQFMCRFKEKATPECLINFLDDLNITEKIKDKNGLEFIDIILDGFQEALGDSIYVDSFIIKREAGQFFCLFFFTSNKLGYLKMLEAKWKIDMEDGRGWGIEQDIGLFSDVTKTPATDKLRSFIVNYLKKGPKSNGDLYDFIISKRFLPKHGTDILKSIADNLEVKPTDGSKARKNAFYLNDKNPEKAIIKLK